MHAFRCHACGHFISAGSAGECNHPHACPSCGAGVSYDPKTGMKIFNVENWEVLCHATPERLAELGFDGEIETHVPTAPSGNVVKTVSLQTGNTLGLTQRTQ